MAKKTPKEIIEAATRTIQFFREHPDKWIRANLAEDSKRRPVSPFSRRAECFCFAGRFARELGPLRGGDRRQYEVGYTEISQNLGRGADQSIWSVNDNQERPQEVEPEFKRVVENYLNTPFNI